MAPLAPQLSAPPPPLQAAPGRPLNFATSYYRWWWTALGQHLLTQVCSYRNTTIYFYSQVQHGCQSSGQCDENYFCIPEDPHCVGRGGVYRWKT